MERAQAAVARLTYAQKCALRRRHRRSVPWTNLLRQYADKTDVKEKTLAEPVEAKLLEGKRPSAPLAVRSERSEAAPLAVRSKPGFSLPSPHCSPMPISGGIVGKTLDEKSVAKLVDSRRGEAT